MWNFSNGQCLTELISEETGKKLEGEITAVECAYEPDKDNEKMAHIIAVGWDKKVHIWADEKEEEVSTCKILPRNEQKGHRDDIMSLAYCRTN